MKLFIYFSVLIIAFKAFAQEPKKIIVPKPESLNDIRTQYQYEVLQKVLDTTSQKYGPAIITHSKLESLQKRSIELVRSGEIDVVSAVTNIERETILEPIRIPIAKGLFGYRICLIKKGNQEKFNKITNLEDWKKLNISTGQGHDWSSTQVLKENGLNVVTTTSYDKLFNMLIDGAFDCFSRSLSEAFAEIEQQKKVNPAIGDELEIEQNLLFHYPSALYFFVRKNNIKLKIRIEEGLNKIIKSKEFDSIFDKYYGDLIEKSSIRNRKKIELKNSSLPTLTPVKRKDYWLDLE